MASVRSALSPLSPVGPCGTRWVPLGVPCICSFRSPLCSITWRVAVMVLGPEDLRHLPATEELSVLGEVGKYRANHTTAWQGQQHIRGQSAWSAFFTRVYTAKQRVCVLAAGTASDIYFRVPCVQSKGYITVDGRID